MQINATRCFIPTVIVVFVNITILDKVSYFWLRCVALDEIVLIKYIENL